MSWIWLLPAWLAYFAIHSLLADLGVKSRMTQRWPSSPRYYRLLYNLLAVLLLLPITALWWLARGPQLWAWTGFGWWLANGAAVLALLGFAWSTRWYDMQEFLGLRQWRGQGGQVDIPGRLALSPVHRYVRHPWYSFGLVFLWTRDMDAATLASVVALSAYVVVGSRLEDRKLIAFHGDLYREYRRRVPGLLPLPWKSLSRAEAARLGAADQR